MKSLLIFFFTVLTYFVQSQTELKYSISVGQPIVGFKKSGITDPNFYFEQPGFNSRKPNATFDTEYMFQLSQSILQKRKLFLNFGLGFGQTFYSIKYPGVGNLNENFYSLYNYRFTPTLGLEKRVQLGEQLTIGINLAWAPRLYSSYTKEFVRSEPLELSETTTVNYSVQFKNKKEEYKVEDNPITYFRYSMNLFYKINDKFDFFVNFQVNRNFNEYFRYKVTTTIVTEDEFISGSIGTPLITFSDSDVVIDSETITTHFYYVGIGLKHRLDWTKFKENLLVY